MLNLALFGKVFIFTEVVSARFLFSLAQLPIADVIQWATVCALLLVALVLLWQTPIQPRAEAELLHHTSTELGKPDESAVLENLAAETIDINDTSESIAALLRSEHQTPQTIQDFSSNPFVLEAEQNLFAVDELSDSGLIENEPIENEPIENEPIENEPIAETAPAINPATPDLNLQQADCPEPTDIPSPNVAPSSSNVTKLKATASWSTWDELVQQSAIDRDNQDNTQPNFSTSMGTPLTWSTWDELSQPPENSSTAEPTASVQTAGEQSV